MLESVAPVKDIVELGFTVAEPTDEVITVVLATYGLKSTQSLRSNVDPFTGEVNSGISAVKIVELDALESLIG